MALTRLNSLSIPANTIVAADIEAGSITTAKIANDQVTGAKLNPPLVQGDIIYADGTDTITRLAKGTATQVLAINSGATAPEWVNAASGAYSDWSIITSATNPLVVKGQYISNSGSALTHTLPTASAPGNVGDSIIICNAGAGLVTIARNSSNINSAAEDGTLPQGNSVQLVYVSDAIGWFEI